MQVHQETVPAQQQQLEMLHGSTRFLILLDGQARVEIFLPRSALLNQWWQPGRIAGVQLPEWFLMFRDG